MEHKGLPRLLKAVDCGKVDCDVVYDLTRWARNRDEEIRLLADLVKKVRYVSVGENIDFETSSGIMIA